MGYENDKIEIMNKFLAEIYEQPAALQRTLDFYSTSEGERLLKIVKDVVDKNSFEQIIFVGMGSSFFTSNAAMVLFNQLQIPSFATNASELLHYNYALLTKKTLLICSSQSGESFEITELLKRCTPTVFCVGITNETDSTLARNSEVALFTKAGKEEMTSTKTYVSTLLASYILGMYLAGRWNEKSKEKVKNLIDSFSLTLEFCKTWVNDALSFFGDLPALQIIARGAVFATAQQSALMFKEAVKVAASGNLGGEFRHGPMEMVKDGFKSIMFTPGGKTFAQNLKMAEDIAGFGGKVLLITNKKINLSNSNIMQVYIDEQDEYLFAIQSIIPVQIFIDSFAKQRGFEAGSFSRGAKVTVTE